MTFPPGTRPLQDKWTHGDATSSITKCLGPGSLQYCSDTFTGLHCKKYRSQSPRFSLVPPKRALLHPGDSTRAPVLHAAGAVLPVLRSPCRTRSR